MTKMLKEISLKIVHYVIISTRLRPLLVQDE